MRVQSQCHDLPWYVNGPTHLHHFFAFHIQTSFIDPTKVAKTLKVDPKPSKQ